MRLPKHKLDELDYFDVEEREYIGEANYGVIHTWKLYQTVIRLYWKKKKFLGIPYRPRTTVIKFRCVNVPHRTDYYVTHTAPEAKELLEQLNKWVTWVSNADTNEKRD